MLRPTVGFGIAALFDMIAYQKNECVFAKRPETPRPLIRHVVRTLICLGFFTAFVCGRAQSATGTTIGGQLVEHRIAPIGIDVPNPRFSWQLMGTTPGLRQTGYQIQVTSGAPNGPVMWDSGWVVSDQSHLIAYAGTLLKSSSSYYWRVRIQDENGTASAWSDWTRWVTGYLNPATEFSADWIGASQPSPAAPSGTGWFSIDQAQWISVANPVNGSVGSYRKKFVLPANTSRVSIAPLVNSRGMLFMNGVEVFRGMNIGAFDLPRYLDITPCIHSGTNVLALQVAENDTGKHPGVLVSMRIEQSDGTVTRIFTDGSWEATTNSVMLWGNNEQPSDNWKPVAVLGLPGAKNTTGQGDANLILPVYGDKSFMPPPTYLRKEITLSKPVRMAVYHGSAQGLYDLYVNGQRLTPTGYNPGWTQYDKHTDYVSTDVTPALKTGANALGVVLADGWFRGNLLWVGRQNFGKDLWISGQLEVEYTDGSHDTFRTDSTWKAGYGPILQSDTMNGEIYDARLEQPGWANAGFAEQGWNPAAVMPRSADGKFNTQIAHQTDPVAVEMELAPQTITQTKPGVYLVDFGQNFGGWVRLNVKGSAGQMIYLRMGEDLNSDGTLFTENLGTINPSELYICKGGGGVETWEPRFAYCGFRYVQVAGLTEAPTTDTFTGIVAHSGGPITSTFDSSSPLVNRMFQNVLWSQRSNFFEIMTDCPQRSERFGWNGDAHFFMPSAVYNQNNASFFIKKFQDCLDTQKSSGEIGNGSPGHNPGAGGNAALDWGAVLMSVPWEVWQRYGDPQPIIDNYDSLKAYMGLWQNFADAVDNNGDYRIIGDWLSSEAHPSKAFLGRVFGYQLSTQMAAFAKLAGKPADEVTFTNLAAHFADEVRSMHIAADGTATGDMETSYANIGSTGLYTPQQKPAVMDKFQQRLATDKYGVYCGFNGVGKLLPALTSMGLIKEASKVLVNTNYPGWGNMVSLGATTTWETWGAKTAPGVYSGKSMNHFTFAGYGEWLMGNLVGLRAESPGYKVVHVEPTVIPDLSWASASFMTPYGVVSNRWDKQAGGISMDLTVPPNSSANVVFPLDALDITQQGQPVTGTNVNGQVNLAVESGLHHFFWNVKSNLSPTISPVPDTAIYNNTSTNVAFSVWDTESGPGPLTVSATSSNPALIPDKNLVFGGSGWSRTLAITPLPNQVGSSTITINVSDGTNTTSTSFQFSSLFTNDLPPTISKVSDVSTNAYTSANVSVTVADPDTPLAGLTVSGVASDKNLVPDGNFQFSGSGSSRSVTITPAPGQTGTCTITLTVRDNQISTSTTFKLTVVTGPDTDGDGIPDGQESWLGRKPASAADFGFEFNQDDDFQGWTTSADIPDALVADGLLSGSTLSGDTHLYVKNLNFNGNSVGNLAMKIRSSATGVVQLYWGRVGSTGYTASKMQQVNYTTANQWQICTFPVSTHAQWMGQTITTLRLDPINASNQTFDIDWIRAVNGTMSPPSISAIPNQTVAANTPTAALPFTIGSNWAPASSLEITGTSSNPNLLSDTNFTFGGFGANHTLTMTPNPNLLGSAAITVTVSDGIQTASNVFNLSVTGTALDNWRFGHFGSTANSGIAADTANPDGDGWTNLQEYILGANPKTPDSKSLTPATAGSAILFTFTATKATGPGYEGLARSYDVETTTDLTNPLSWTALPGYTNILGENQTVTVNQPLSGNARFYRLKVRLQP